MDTGHSRGDRRPDGEEPVGHWGHAHGYDSAYDGRDNRGWDDRDERGWETGQAAGAYPQHGPADPGEWLHAPAEDAAGPAEFDVNGYRQRLMSGPGAELYGMGGGGLVEPDEGAAYAAYAAFDERSLDPGPQSQSFEMEPPPGRSFDTGPFRRSPYDTGQFHSGPIGEPYPDGRSPGDTGSWSGPTHTSPGAPSPYPRHREAEPETPSETSGLVRPYFRTKGRTRPSYDLKLESLISTSERGRRLERVRVPEHRSICGLCLDTRSVAEVAALLKLPLGVVRILIGDVAGLGLVLVHTSTAMVGDRPSIEFMERVLSGLRRI